MSLPGPIRTGEAVGRGRAGELTRVLQREFMRIAQGETADRHGWLTHVRSESSALVAENYG